MAKRRNTNIPSPIEDRARIKPKTKDGEADKRERQRKRALILSALTAGGIFQMNSWQVQAHGNRSSHSVLAAAAAFFSPSDFVLMREEFAGDTSSSLTQLAQVSGQINTLFSMGLPIPNALRSQRENLIKSIGLVRPQTTEVLNFLQSGDTAGAIAAIEGEGFPERVLSSYKWVLLDIGNLGIDINITLPVTHKTDFVAIAGPAVAYCQTILPQIIASNGSSALTQVGEVEVAEILHDIASYILVPGTTPISSSDLQLGMLAANLALQIRTNLQQPPELLRAEWMVAQYQILSGNISAAVQNLTSVLNSAQQLNDVPLEAWTLYSRSQALRQSQPGQASQDLAQAQQIVNGFPKNQDTTIEFLRVIFAAG
jgi:hypothetical protein